MRSLIFALFVATPAVGWEFTPGLPCVLNHGTASADVELTYDPSKPLYTITISRGAPWPDGPVFTMRFDGPSGLTISTNEHRLSADRRSVTVTDRGFGNVLDGLQFNESATAVLGDTSVTVSLADASGSVADFRLCRAQPGV